MAFFLVILRFWSAVQVIVTAAADFEDIGKCLSFLVLLRLTG